MSPVAYDGGHTGELSWRGTTVSAGARGPRKIRGLGRAVGNGPYPFRAPGRVEGELDVDVPDPRHTHDRPPRPVRDRVVEGTGRRGESHRDLHGIVVDDDAVDEAELHDRHPVFGVEHVPEGRPHLLARHRHRAKALVLVARADGRPTRW